MANAPRCGRSCVDQKTNRVAFAIVSKDLYVIPCHALKATGTTDEVQLNRSMDEMDKAPRVEKDIIARLDNKEYCARLAEFYGVMLDK
ncbi:MAG: hypothetical protein KDB53_20455 [Planctomycetes bacterium]|nr:hypothetical protein [Planctomycetota bacterium]